MPPPSAHLDSPGRQSTVQDLELYVKSTKAGFQFQSKPPGLTFFYHSSTADPATVATRSSSEPNAASDAFQHEDDCGSISKLRRVLLSITLALTSFIYGMNATVIGNTQIFITEHFEGPAKLGWIGVSFALGAAVAILPLSKASRLFDKKWLCISCLAVFTAATAFCGGASSMNALIVGRAFAGAAGAGLAVTNAQLFSRFAMRADYAWYGFTTTSILGAGCIVGPVISGALCESSRTWRWVFYVQTIALGSVIPAYLILLPSGSARREVSFLASLRSIDLLGAILLAGGLVSFALAFTSGGSLYAWSSSRTIAAITLFALCSACLGITQWFTAPPRRLIPVSLHHNPQIVLLYITAASASAALLISIYYIPVHFLYVFGDDGNIGALRVIPFVSFWWWLLVVCGAVLPRVGYHGVWYVLSGLCLTAGGATMYTVRTDTTPQTIAGFMVLYILGLLTSEAHVSTGSAIIAVCEEKAEVSGHTPDGRLDATKRAELNDVFGFAQALGGMVGLVVASAVFQNGAYADLSRALDGHGFSEGQVRGAITGVRGALWKSQADFALRRVWLDSLVRNVDKVWLLVAVAGGVYTICAYCMSRRRFVV